MTDRSVHPDGFVPVPPARVENAAYPDRSSQPFHPTPPPAHPPDVSRVLSQPVVSNPADGRVWGGVASDPLAQRLAELTCGVRPAFDIPAADRPVAATAAAHCPDLFLLDVPQANQLATVAAIVTAAVGHGQRVAVITSRPEDLIPHLGPVTDRLGWAITASERAARGDRLRERLAAAEQAERLTAEEVMVRAEFDRLVERATTELVATDAYRVLAAERVTNEARWQEHQNQRAAAERELADLRAHPAGGFLKRLFGGGKNGEADARIAAIEGRLRDLDTARPPEPDAVFRDGRDRLLAARREELAAELDGRLDRLRASRNGTYEPAEQLREQLAELTAGAKDAVRVVVGPPAAVGSDPSFTPSHPEAAPRFHRIVWLGADTPDRLRDAARLAASWVLVGSLESDEHFADLWAKLDDAPWGVEGGCPLARLTTVPPDRRPHLVREPLIGRPEVELRYLDTDAGRELVEIHFPVGTSAAEARAFVAAELGEVRVVSLGAPVWHEAADAVTCCWPAVEGDPTMTPCAVDLGDGVMEQVCGHLTASVRFATAAGWTRESAAGWLAARCHTSARTAVIR